MMMKRQSCIDDDGSSSSSAQQQQPQIHQPGRNVFRLLVRREIAPRTKCLARKQWGEMSEKNYNPNGGTLKDPRRELLSWAEAESLRYLLAKYCPLEPSPRSTIAAAFSPNGKILASTHGDHTVKIINCQNGKCEKVLSGHRRTPWVVRFHPLNSEILASGSLDHEVRLWNANTSDCMGYHDFYRPIASIAFHAEGELLAVAAGHKLYFWQYNSREKSQPTIVLRTRRSLRAVHFHPNSAPFLITAEVNDLDSSDSAMASATSLGYSHYPPPAVYMGNLHSMDHLRLAGEQPLMPLPLFYSPSFFRGDLRPSTQVGNRPISLDSMQVDSSASLQVNSNAIEQHDQLVSSMETSHPLPYNEHGTGSLVNYTTHGVHSSSHGTSMDVIGSAGSEHMERYPQSGSSNVVTSGTLNDVNALQFTSHSGFVAESTSNHPNREHDVISQDQSRGWELPFLQGLLMGQSQGTPHSNFPLARGQTENLSEHIGVHPATVTSNLTSGDVPMPSLGMPSSSTGLAQERSGLRDQFSHPDVVSASGSGQVAMVDETNEVVDPFPIFSRIQSQLSASLAATAAAELPCTVKLRVWPHDVKNPCALLRADRCRLTIPHAVLCSEMGAHFSPCGRYLAACVACVLPQFEADPGTQLHQDAGAATSPTRHSISARQIMYELRIYSLEESTFGSVLISRAIRAAHCLTSIQFSPTSEHILLAYGRRHSSLLKSIILNGESSVSVFTVLEVYRVSDMELVSVLPSAEDEVNVACFHPLAGGGLVYGTKEGKLRLMQFNGAHNISGPYSFSEANMVEVQTYALEG